ncbi:tyrosine-type recombinase/integrase [Bradyrhizobium sp. USDA 4369]
MPKLTKTVVDAAIPRSKQFTIWCSELKGFGVFVHPSGSRTFFVDYRNRNGGRKRLTIGRHGTISAEQARKLAIATLGETLRGQDPAEDRARHRKALTVKELCERYLAAAEKGLILGKGNRPKKASSLYVDKGRICRHIVPLLGRKRLQDIKPADINKFIEDVASGKSATIEKTKNKRGKSVVRGGLGTATRTAGLLSGILTYAVNQGLIEKNAAHGVRKPADGVKKRRLSDDEYRLLGKILLEKGTDARFETTVKIIRHLALTACRRGEAINLKRSEVDVDGSCLRLNDSKEGASVRPVGLPVLNLLTPLLSGNADGFVFEGTVKGKPLVGFPRLWSKLLKDTTLADLTPHVLRHSFSSIANDLGFTEATIGTLMGHSRGSITGRYIHTVDSLLVMAADTIAGYIQGLLNGKKFRRTIYALDYASREAALARLFEQSVDPGDDRVGDGMVAA